MSSNSTPSASALNATDRNRVLNILERNWQAEMRGCHTYELWAERETEPQRRIAFRTLAKAEKHHADLWAERIHALGVLNRPIKDQALATPIPSRVAQAV